MSAEAPAPGMVRDLGHIPGARFFREGEELFFAFVMDASSILGPRLATAKDQEDHPAAWAEFCAAEDVDPLDRDAKGGPGGSLQGSAGKRRQKVKNEPAHDHSAGS